MSSIKTALALPLTMAFALAGTVGCDKSPALDKVRFELGAAEPVAKRVTYEKTPDSDTSSKFHGIGEKGITIPEGVAVSLNIEPRGEGVADPLDGELTVSTTDPNIATVRTVSSFDRPRRQVVLLASAPGKTTLRVEVYNHDNTNEIPITVTPQQ